MNELILRSNDGTDVGGIPIKTVGGLDRSKFVNDGQKYENTKKFSNVLHRVSFSLNYGCII